MLSTQPGQSIEGNISSVFGSKQLQSLMEFNQSAPSSEVNCLRPSVLFVESVIVAATLNVLLRHYCSHKGVCNLMW